MTTRRDFMVGASALGAVAICGSMALAEAPRPDVFRMTWDQDIASIGLRANGQGKSVAEIHNSAIALVNEIADRFAADEILADPLSTALIHSMLFCKEPLLTVHEVMRRKWRYDETFLKYDRNFVNMGQLRQLPILTELIVSHKGTGIFELTRKGQLVAEITLKNIAFA